MFVQTWALPRTQRWFKRWPGLRQGPSPADLSYCTQRRVLRVRKGLSQSNGWRTCIRAESTAEATAFQIISNISHHFTTQFALKKEMKIFRCCQSFSDFGLWVLSPKNAMATWAPTLVTWLCKPLRLSVLLAPQDSRRSSEVSQTSIWDFCASSVTSGLAEVFHHQGVTKGQWNLPLIGHVYPPTPALAKAGSAPGTTAGVELVFLSNRHPKATSMASDGRPSVPFATP